MPQLTKYHWMLHPNDMLPLYARQKLKETHHPPGETKADCQIKGGPLRRMQCAVHGYGKFDKGQSHMTNWLGRVLVHLHDDSDKEKKVSVHVVLKQTYHPYGGSLNRGADAAAAAAAAAAEVESAISETTKMVVFKPARNHCTVRYHSEIGSCSVMNTKLTGGASGNNHSSFQAERLVGTPAVLGVWLALPGL